MSAELILAWVVCRIYREWYLLHTFVVQKGEQRVTESEWGGLIVDHGNLNSLWVSSDAQADERHLDDGQQELETQGAAKNAASQKWRQMG